MQLPAACSVLPAPAVLPAANRMRRSSDFSLAVRNGSRARTPRVVIHQRREDDAVRPPIVGFVVSRSVGGSVTRNAVTRRLRAQLGARLDSLPPGSRTVVRALPAAAAASSAQLGSDLDRTLARLSPGANRA